ncbi:MAG: hypothetical protein V3T60_03825, partial [Candidatus Binatia bacterium]
TGFESPCSTNGASCRFSPLWSNGPRLHGGNPIGFVPASRGGVTLNLLLSHHRSPLWLVNGSLSDLLYIGQDHVNYPFELLLALL